MYGYAYDNGKVVADKSVLALAAEILIIGDPKLAMYFVMRMGQWLMPERLARMSTFIDKHRADGRTDAWIIEHTRDMYMEWQAEDDAARQGRARPGAARRGKARAATADS